MKEFNEDRYITNLKNEEDGWPDEDEEETEENTEPTRQQLENYEQQKGGE